MPNKTFFTYEQQIEKLTKEKQLVISDAEFAKETLQKFHLVGIGFFTRFDMLSLQVTINHCDYRICIIQFSNNHRYFFNPIPSTGGSRFVTLFYC